MKKVGKRIDVLYSVSNAERVMVTLTTAKKNESTCSTHDDDNFGE